MLVTRGCWDAHVMHPTASAKETRVRPGKRFANTQKIRKCPTLGANLIDYVVGQIG